MCLLFSQNVPAVYLNLISPWFWGSDDDRCIGFKLWDSDLLTWPESLEFFNYMTLAIVLLLSLSGLSIY